MTPVGRATAERDSAVLLAEAMARSHRSVMLTGAGISTESGIPDFRSPGGVWSKETPVMFQDFLDDASERQRYWRMRRDSYPAMRDAEPNEGHRAIGELARRGLLSLLITQNIDGLHQRAGLPQDAIVEIHGNATIVLCLSCTGRVPMEEIQPRLEAGDLEPRCPCGGILKSATVSFGQPIPEEALSRSFAAAESCDLFVVVGSSLQVEPAASLPLLAKRAGARLAIVTLSDTPLDRVADVRAREACGPFLGRVIQALGASQP